MYQQYYNCFGISITSGYFFNLVGGYLGLSFADDLTDHLYGIFMKKKNPALPYNLQQCC